MRIILIVVLCSWLQAASAQFPERPIRLVVPQAAGSATDNIPPQAPAGHMPWDLQPGSTMTNATVAATVEAVKDGTRGRELTLTYEGGAQKIAVPESASISTLVPGQRSHLVPGAPVNLTMDGNRVALRIQVSRP